MSVADGFVLAAGLGTRLRPLSEQVPKPVWPFFDLPIAAHALHGLARAGVGRAVVNVHHLGHILQEELAPRVPPGMELLWSMENPILGTGGALAPWLDRFRGAPLYLINGDTFRDGDLRELEQAHEATGAAATLLLAPLPEGATGPIEVDESGRIVRFLKAEVPGGRHRRVCDFAGAHLLGPEALDMVGDVAAAGKQTFCINMDVHAALVARGARVQGVLLGPEAFWSDLGTPERYLDGHFALLDAGRLPPGVPGRLVPGNEIDSGGGEIVGPCFLGEGARVERGGVAGPHAVLGAGVRVEPGGRVARSVVWRGQRVLEPVVDSIAAPGGVLRVHHAGEDRPGGE